MVEQAMVRRLLPAWSGIKKGAQVLTVALRRPEGPRFYREGLDLLVAQAHGARRLTCARVVRSMLKDRLRFIEDRAPSCNLRRSGVLAKLVEAIDDQGAQGVDRVQDLSQGGLMVHEQLHGHKVHELRARPKGVGVVLGPPHQLAVGPVLKHHCVHAPAREHGAACCGRPLEA